MEILDLIKQMEVDGSDIIPSGHIPPNPAELLGPRKMKELVECLLEEYNHVILDRLPVMGFADSRLP
ncbi:MAG TPA: hypothetical protein VLB01_05020 [Thermodesulfobacteriota bacterium]|nr:hypothetical protein [Thermodesulfobacteriota bacterium]